MPPPRRPYLPARSVWARKGSFARLANGIHTIRPLSVCAKAGVLFFLIALNMNRARVRERFFAGTLALLRLSIQARPAAFKRFIKISQIAGYRRRTFVSGINRAVFSQFNAQYEKTTFRHAISC